MSRIESKLRPSDPTFQANRERNEALAAELRARLVWAQAGGPEESRRRHTERGKLLPRQRVSTKPFQKMLFIVVTQRTG